jgi:hypothetical protein
MRACFKLFSQNALSRASRQHLHGCLLGGESRKRQGLVKWDGGP